MKLHTDIKISIDGTQIKALKELKLHQEIDAHHTIELICRRDVLEKKSDKYNRDSEDMLGQTLLLTISLLEEDSSASIYSKNLKFKGIVTNITNEKGFYKGTGDLVIISAKSTSILTDDGPHNASYSDIDLNTMLRKVFQKYDRSALRTSINARRSDILPYCVQNGESSYQYASRLAAQYGEWFYYDGENLIFGKPDSTEEVYLSYGVDLQEFSRSLQPLSNKYTYFTANYFENEQQELATSAIGESLNGRIGTTTKVSQGLYPHNKNVHIISVQNDQKMAKSLEAMVSVQKKAEELRQLKVTGVSYNPAVSLGKTIKIRGEEGSQGSFRITKVTHHATETGNYYNNFEGVSTEKDVYPKTNITIYPESKNQVAIVTDNVDPNGLSRVKVQFHWQKDMGEFTPWLRVLTPHSGGEKGFHFIPEIGEEVLIGFDGGNAERPFVLGSFYNGRANAKNWNSGKNDIKAIRTRSGHTIELNDKEGSEFITITDKNKNIINIDTAKNNITITALEKMTLNAKNFEMNVTEDALFNIGQNTQLITKNNLDITTSGNTTNTVEKDMHTNVIGAITQQSRGADIHSKEDMRLSGAGLASFQGGGVVKISKG